MKNINQTRFIYYIKGILIIIIKNLMKKESVEVDKILYTISTQ